MQIVKQYRPLEKKKKKNRNLTELKQNLIFSLFVNHKKLYTNCEDSNYKNVPSQHLPQKCQEALLKMKQLSEKVPSNMQKNFKAAILNHLKPYLVYFFIIFTVFCCSAL